MKPAAKTAIALMSAIVPMMVELKVMLSVALAPVSCCKPAIRSGVINSRWGFILSKNAAITAGSVRGPVGSIAPSVSAFPVKRS